MTTRTIIALLLVALTFHLAQGQIVAEGNSGSTNFQNVNMTQLMTDLGMTEQDLKDMQNTIKANNNNSSANSSSNSSSNGSASGQTNASPAPASPSVTPAPSVSQNSGAPTMDNIPTSSSGFFDLASLESMLGIKPLQTSAASKKTVIQNDPTPKAPSPSPLTSTQNTGRATGTFDLLDLSDLEKKLGLTPPTSSTTQITSNTQQTSTQTQKNQNTQTQTNTSNQNQGNSSQSSSGNGAQNKSSNANSANGNTEQKTNQLINDLEELQKMLDKLKENKNPSSQNQNQNQNQGQSQTPSQTQTQSQPQSNSQDQTQSSSQTPGTSPASSSTQPQQPQNSATSSNSNQVANGPGPKDPNLPPVIDISQATVLYSIIPGQNASNQSTPAQQTAPKAPVPSESQIDLNKHNLVVDYSKYPAGYDPLTQKTSTNSNNAASSQVNSQNNQSKEVINVPQQPQIPHIVVQNPPQTPQIQPQPQQQTNVQNTQNNNQQSINLNTNQPQIIISQPTVTRTQPVQPQQPQSQPTSQPVQNTQPAQTSRLVTTPVQSQNTQNTENFKNIPLSQNTQFSSTPSPKPSPSSQPQIIQSSPQQNSAPVDPTWQTPEMTDYIKKITTSRLDPSFQNQNASTNNNNNAGIVQNTQNSRLDPAYQNQNQQKASNGNINVVNFEVPVQPKVTPQVLFVAPQQSTQPQPRPQSNLQREPVSSSLSNAIQSYQQRTTSKLAVYSLTASYKTFSEFFILALNDPYLPILVKYLSDNYGNYVNNGKLTSGFKRYNSYDYSLTYQLLYNTHFGLFNAYIDYKIETNTLTLKSLSIISFPMLVIDLENCQKPNISKQQCQVCASNYRNFMGRCRLFDPSCLLYLTDECGACRPPMKLSKGVCM